MILVIGGVYQGKLKYALGRFGLAAGDVYYCDAGDAGLPCGKKIIYELDKWILALIKNGEDSDDHIMRFIAQNRDAVVICNDISCGVVPVDSALRKWREAVGRALMELTRESGEVIRLFCGIPSRLK